MKTCAYCGRTIILGGVKDNDLIFCNKECHEFNKIGPKTKEDNSGWYALLILLFIVYCIYSGLGGIYRMIGIDEHFDYNITKSIPKCLQAIEERNWENYRATIEPSAVIQPRSPGIKVHFVDPKVRVIKQNESSAQAEVNTNIKIEGSEEKLPIVVPITLVKVNQPNFLGSLGLKKWYIAASEVQTLPFNYFQE